MGLGSLVVKGVVVAGAVAAFYGLGGASCIERIKSGNYVVEDGFVDPRQLKVTSVKNGAGKVEGVLRYGSKEQAVDLPCKTGPLGPLCGSVDYWWSSISAQERANLVVDEWDSLDALVRRQIVGTEFEMMMDEFYKKTTPQKPDKYFPTSPNNRKNTLAP